MGIATALVAWRRTILVTPLRMGLYCDFEEGVKGLVLAWEADFSRLVDSHKAPKSVSNLSVLAGKKLWA